MKVLIVSWSVLPQSGGSSVIIENLAENFSADECIVLGSSAWSKKNRPTRNPTKTNFKYFFSEMYFMGRGYRYFIWFRKMRFKPLVNRIKKLIKEENIDHVIGVYPNDFYCLAASRASADLKVPFSSYFHNTYTDNQAIVDPKAEAYQKEIFNNSENIFVMSKGMQGFYEEEYGSKKFIPLVHTFNKFPEIRAYKPFSKTENKPIKLVAIGNFNESNLDASIRFLNAIADNPNYILSVYTHVPKILLNRRGFNTDLLDYKGSVLPEEIHEVLQEHDICILTHGFTGGYGEIEYKTIFPTRTIPLLLSGKPILAHSPKQSFLNKFIEENGCAHLIDEADEKKILEGLELITNDHDYQKKLVESAKITARLFYGPEVVKNLVTQLKSS